MLTVVTAIFGRGFHLYEPTEAWTKTRFVCFTDREEIGSNRWEVVRLDLNLTPRRNNRYVKALLHRYIDGPTLYIDADFQVTRNPVELVTAALASSSCWAATRHPQRDCLFAEAEFCLRRKQLEDRWTLEQQVARYRAAAMPEHFGLWAGGILFRRGDKNSIRLSEEWWTETESGSERDQVSLPFTSWRLELPPQRLPGYYNKLPGLARRGRAKK